MSPRRCLNACIAVLGLVTAACGNVAGEAASAPALQNAPATPSPAPREFLEIGAGEPSPESRPPRQMAAPAPRSLERWEWAVHSKSDRLDVWSGPEGGALLTSIDAVNPWEQRLAFPIRDVVESGGETWYQVLLGIEPNGSDGWVRGDDVALDRMRHQVVIDLSQRVLRHYRNGNLRHRFTVGIGAPDTPTTRGRFFVWAHLNPSDSSGPYGSYLLGLSGFSEVLTDWPGGGRMAIHGTDDPTDPGRRISCGCARVYNRQMNKLRPIPMGTTVLIRR